MKISVIVPFHDEKRYLMDCLDSLEEQSFRDFEVICVCDHCETDIQEIILDKPLTIPVKVVILREGTGVAAARNLGLENASGEWIYFLDCDDYIEKDAFERLIKYEEDVIYSDIHPTWYKRQVYYKNGQQLDEMNQQKKKDFEGDAQNPFEYVVNDKRSMRNVTVHSMLIRKQLIDRMELRFEEDLMYLSDYPFVLLLLDKALTTRYCEDSMYIKRKHNDPINLPSLIQTKDKQRVMKECVYAYERTLAGCSSKVLELVQKQFLHFFTRSAAPHIREAGKKDQKELFELCIAHLKEINPKYNNSLTRYQRKMIKKALTQGLGAVVKMLNRQASMQTLRRVLRSRAQLKKFCYRKIFARQPVLDNTILLESFFGKNYSDSPKYIFEYMNEHFPGKYNYVWVMNDKKKLPFAAKQTRRFSFRYYYYLARSKYIVFNSRQPEYFIKREGNIFLETWHGTPLKKLVFDMEEVTTAAPLYKQQFYTQTRSWDYLVAPNEFSAEIFRHAFMYDGPLLKFGYPRNDILHRQDKEEVAIKIKERLHIPSDKKVILYAPTWRDDEFYGSGQYKFTLQLDLHKMKEKLGEEYIILLRTHYFIADVLDMSEYQGFAYNLSKYDDIAELYLISNILITDYSSVFFDYANLKRPMLFYTYDYEKYRDVLRGFYINMEEEIPGPLLYTTEEIIKEIQNLPAYEEKYGEKYQTFYNKYCSFEDGKATENIVKTVFG